MQITYDDSEQDVACLPEDLWDTFLPYGQPLDGRLAVTLSRKSSETTIRKGNHEFTIWCISSVRLL